MSESDECSSISWHPRQDQPAGAEQIGLGERIRVRISRSRLDAELAAGADPSVSPYLRWRTRELTGHDNRERLAHSLREPQVLLESPPDPRDPRVRPDSAQIRDARPLICEIEDLLRSSVPVYCRGIASVSQLLSDGNGPIYVARRHGDLSKRLGRILESCSRAVPN